MRQGHDSCYISNISFFIVCAYNVYTQTSSYEFFVRNNKQSNTKSCSSILLNHHASLWFPIKSWILPLRKDSYNDREGFGSMLKESQIIVLFIYFKDSKPHLLRVSSCKVVMLLQTAQRKIWVSQPLKFSRK